MISTYNVSVTHCTYSLSQPTDEEWKLHNLQEKIKFYYKINDILNSHCKSITFICKPSFKFARSNALSL